MIGASTGRLKFVSYCGRSTLRHYTPRGIQTVTTLKGMYVVGLFLGRGALTILYRLPKLVLHDLYGCMGVIEVSVPQQARSFHHHTITPIAPRFQVSLPTAVTPWPDLPRPLSLPTKWLRQLRGSTDSTNSGGLESLPWPVYLFTR